MVIDVWDQARRLWDMEISGNQKAIFKYPLFLVPGEGVLYKPVEMDGNERRYRENKAIWKIE